MKYQAKGTNNNWSYCLNFNKIKKEEYPVLQGEFLLGKQCIWLMSLKNIFYIKEYIKDKKSVYGMTGPVKIIPYE